MVLERNLHLLAFFRNNVDIHLRMITQPYEHTQPIPMNTFKRLVQLILIFTRSHHGHLTVAGDAVYY
jgi:hypothetical protein